MHPTGGTSSEWLTIVSGQHRGASMTPAIGPRASRDAARMLVVGPGDGVIRDCLVTELPDLLQPGDLLVVNDAATLPASLAATTSSGAPIEIRLLQHLGGSDWIA